jgi:hypothetical protein
MAEKAVLDDVEEGGEALILTDGRRLRVKPSDTETVLIWMPTQDLTLRRGKDATFDLRVTNEDTGQTISATKE